jgi:hypothetical protein
VAAGCSRPVDVDTAAGVWPLAPMLTTGTREPGWNSTTGFR